MKRNILICISLLIITILLNGSSSPVLSETKPEKSSGTSILDSIKDLENSIKDLKDVLKGKKTDKPDTESSEKPAEPSAAESKPKPQPKSSGKVFISVSDDGTETASGLSAGDRLWAKASAGTMEAASTAPPMRMSPPMDINKLTQSQYNGAVSAAMAAMRDLMGELSPDEEAKFNAKWAPLFGFPTEASVTYFNKLNPLLSEFLSLRAAVATASVEFDGAWEEAVLAASYDSEEGAREALGIAEIQKDHLTSLQARMIQIVKAIQVLGNPPDPIQAQQQARKRHQAAIQITRTVAPVITVTPAKVSGKINTPYTFTAKVANIAGKFTLKWNFGDGISAAGSTAPVKHTYKKDGKYTVSAVAYDQKNARITEGTAQVIIDTKSGTGVAKTGVWVLAQRIQPHKLDKVNYPPGYHRDVSEIKWDINESYWDGQGYHRGDLNTLNRYSWGIPASALKPGDTLNMMVTLKNSRLPEKHSRPGGEIVMHIKHLISENKGPGVSVIMNMLKLDQVRKDEHTETRAYVIPSPASLTEQLIVTITAFHEYEYMETKYIYKFNPDGGDDVKPANVDPAVASAQKAADEAEKKARQETIEFHKSNIMIIEKNLSKDREELAKETDPVRRASLEFRILQGTSDAQAEKDLITSLETGQFVHTRTAFDDYAHAQFIQNIRENQKEIEDFNRASAALYRLAGMLPGTESRDAQDFIDKQLTLEVKTKMDRETVNKIASALGSKVQGHYQAEAAKSEENAAWANFGLEAAENIKEGADTAMMICSVFGGRPVDLVYQAATGYIEGGPVEAAYKTISFFGTTAHTAVEAFKGYREGGLSGAVSSGAKAFLTAKVFEYGISKALGGVKPAAKKPTVKEQFELAKFKQARSDGESLVKDFQRAQGQLEAAARAGKSAKELTKLQEQLRDKAASINSSPHAKNFLKYKGDFHAQRTYNAHMKAVHANVEAKFHDRMAKQGWNKQELQEFRNTSSAGSVGMDYDIGLNEKAMSALARDGKRATVHQWQKDAQKAWDQSYRDVTKRSAGMSWENVTTSTHAESYKDLAWLGSDKTKVMSTWAQQSADVTRYKAWHMMNDPSLSRMEALQEVSRGTAKDINTKLQPLLNNSKPANPASAESLKQAKAHWQKIQTTLDAFGNNTIDPITAERRIRELTGGKGIPEVVNDMGTVMEGLIKSFGAK
ncbi:MAG: PKD domain-containing protein [Armatimonadota bacterium]